MDGIRGEHSPFDRENLASCQQDQRQEHVIKNAARTRHQLQT